MKNTKTALWTRRELLAGGGILSLGLLAATLTAAIPVSAKPASSASKNFTAHMNAGQIYVAPGGGPIENNHKGQAIFKFNEDCTEMYYKFIVSNIENLGKVHLHLGAPGEPFGTKLFDYTETTSGRFNGVYTEGTITDPDLVSDLYEAILAGDLHADAHYITGGPVIRGHIW
jgi:hypothetical protein